MRRGACIALLNLALALLPAAAQQPETQPPAQQPAVEQPSPAKPDDAQKPGDTAAPDSTPPGAPKAVLTPTQQSICMLLESAAWANGLPVEFFARVIWQESRFRIDAVGPVTRSGARARGIAQFMPGTAAERNLLDPMDPVQALPKSAEFLRELRGEFGNLGLAAAAYNAGLRRVHDWIAGKGSMPAETRNYVLAITGQSVEQWAKASGDADVKQRSGRDCGTLMALLKREPNRFVAALEQHIVLGAAQPWGAILGADNSRSSALGKYATLQQRHAALLQGRDPILIERRRGPLPRYQVRVGAETRAAAADVCRQIHREHGDCVVLRNPRG